MTTARQNDTSLSLSSDVRGNCSYTPGFAQIKFSVQLSSGVATSFTVPSSHATWNLSFSYSPISGLWVARNATASFPAGSTFQLTNSEYNPSPRTVYAGDVISVISANAIPELGVLLYATSG